MTREAAGERFAAAWGAGALATVLGRTVDLPSGVGIAMAVAVLGALLFYGLSWLRLATRDGTLRRELAEYAWAFLSLVLIVAAAAALTCVVLLIAGEPLTGSSVATGTAIGVVGTIAAWLVISRDRPIRP